MFLRFSANITNFLAGLVFVEPALLREENTFFCFHYLNFYPNFTKNKSDD